MTALRIAVAVTGLLISGAGAARAQTTINIGGSSGTTGYHFSGTGGPIGRTAVGQTFTVPTDAVLLNYSLILGGYHASSPEMVFRSYIMRWAGDDNTLGHVEDATSLTGNPWLYRSEAMSPVVGAHTVFSFATGGLSLTPGAMYVAFVAPDNMATTAFADVVAHWQPGNPTTYTGGETVYSTATTFAGFTDGAWHVDQNYDLMMQAEFGTNVVPEPATMTLLATGLAGIGALRRRRSKARAT